jgi:hypothetical protein
VFYWKGRLLQSRPDGGRNPNTGLAIVMYVFEKLNLQTCLLTSRCRHHGTAPGLGPWPSSHSPYQHATTRVTNAPRPEDIGVLRLRLHIPRYGVSLWFIACFAGCHKTERVNAEVPLRHDNQEITGSGPFQVNGYPETFVIFLSQMSGQNLNYATTDSF